MSSSLPEAASHSRNKRKRSGAMRLSESWYPASLLLLLSKAASGQPDSVNVDDV